MADQSLASNSKNVYANAPSYVYAPGQPQLYGAATAYGGQPQPVYGGPSQPNVYGGPSQPNVYGGPSQPNIYGGPSQPNVYGGPSQPNAYNGGTPPPYGYNGVPQQSTTPMTLVPLPMQENRGTNFAVRGASLAVQPTGQPVMMRAIEPIPGCPSGLELLAMQDSISIKQTVEVLELLSNLETQNSYTILDGAHQRIYFALEDSDFCARQCLSNLRPLRLRLTDNVGREVLTLDRPFRCDTAWCPFIIPVNFFWLQKMEVHATSGNLKLGSIEQQWSLIKPNIHILDASGAHIMSVTGPIIHYCRCDDIPFPVTTPTGEPMGTIIKKWGGFFREAFTDADNFETSWLVRGLGCAVVSGLSPPNKALLLAAVLLIDFIYYENKKNNNNNR